MHKTDSSSSTSKPTIFCRTCQTNQTLYINLLSNYFPPSSLEDENEEEYERLAAQLPAYKASLDLRYPLVCKDCEGNVDEELRKSERLARSNVLGSWLGGPTRRGGEANPASAPLSPRKKPRIRSGVWLWRIRGLLWSITLVVSIGGSASSTFISPNAGQRVILRMEFIELSPFIPSVATNLPPLSLPILTILSLFWSFWDPLWNSGVIPSQPTASQRAYETARRKNWITLQGVALLSRLIMSLYVSLSKGASSESELRWYGSHLAIEITVRSLSFGFFIFSESLT